MDEEKKETKLRLYPDEKAVQNESQLRIEHPFFKPEENRQGKTDSEDSGYMIYEKKYHFKSEKGTDVEVSIAAEIKDLNKNDLQEILHEYAVSTHNFYLNLGKEINNKP